MQSRDKQQLQREYLVFSNIDNKIKFARRFFGVNEQRLLSIVTILNLKHTVSNPSQRARETNFCSQSCRKRGTESNAASGRVVFWIKHVVVIIDMVHKQVSQPKLISMPIHFTLWLKTTNYQSISGYCENENYHNVLNVTNLSYLAVSKNLTGIVSVNRRFDLCHSAEMFQLFPSSYLQLKRESFRRFDCKSVRQHTMSRLTHTV